MNHRIWLLHAVIRGFHHAGQNRGRAVPSAGLPSDLATIACMRAVTEGMGVLALAGSAVPRDRLAQAAGFRRCMGDAR